MARKVQAEQPAPPVENDFEKRLVDVERRLSMLEQQATVGSKISEWQKELDDTGVMNFDKLSEEWADRTVRKQPPRVERDIVGQTYSQLTSDELDTLAGYLMWGAKRDAAKPAAEMRMRSDGKPWFLTACFDAKLARTWSAWRKAGSPGASPEGGETGDVPWT